MSCDPIYSVWCDHRPLCGAWIAQEHTRSDARRYAKVYGRREGLDLCPEHSGATP